ncbi:PKD domain-containing protein [Spongisporangium articulatum]|uniref:PKD domain-containing protein n=1 Tax=Spongisporangium articulatum TaxID=3362603 RepID=A0ABW8AT95_9ACTN
MSGLIRSRLARGVLAAALSSFAVAAVPFAAAPAQADTAPVPPETTTTYSADALPTVQINGVVWAQTMVGNTVYATGNFTQARPAGSAAGTNQTARSYLVAYNVTTGALNTTWAPTLNAQGLGIAASPDGKTIYVGGDFTTANGVARNRIAAFDATTGALVTAFNASVNGRVRAVDVVGTTVYAGGQFTTAGGVARSRLAAFSSTNGALLSWAPNADAEIFAITAAGPGQMVVGGRFQNIAGTAQRGMAALDATTGAARPWPVNQTIQNYGSDAAIYSLSYDGNQVYGSGYGYLVNNNPNTDANLENTFAATTDGQLVWANGCLGDTYDQASLNGALYSVGHPHNCTPIGGHPQTDPWTYQRAMATTTGRNPDGSVNNGGELNGLPAPQLLHWLPTLDAGTFTGQYQAAWSVTGNSDYIVLGGEFPTVNGTAQQGLVRFATRAIAPNKQGPQLTTDLKPTLVGLAPGTLRIAWRSTWDRDNRRLTYEVLRGNTVINTRTFDSNWWTRPNLAFTDTTATPGSSQTYRIRVTDPLGNQILSSTTTGTVPAGTASAGTYSNAVAADGATNQWRLGESSGNTGYDWLSGSDLTMDASATRGAAGALANSSDTATTFAGTATVPASTTNPITGPQTFSEEAWFRTTSTSGGKILGFGDSATGNSGSYDRHIYLTNNGQVVFGIYNNSVSTLQTGAGLNDGQWHQVVATMSPAGMALYVDGKKIGSRSDVTFAQGFSGYWRVGGDNLNAWPSQPSSFAFKGDIDEVAIYPSVLSLDQVRAHYIASGRTLTVPTRPADGYGQAVWDAQPDLYLRLDETSGSAAKDVMTAETGATYTGGLQQGQNPAPAAPSGRAVTLTGDGQYVVGTTQYSNPQVFSLETWFKTTTTTGGRLIGFGNAASGFSNNYDRHIYMLDNGRLRYGIWIGSTSVVDSPNSYNDGQWHQVVATQGPAGQQLYVDGALVASGGAASPQAYDGYWRLGQDNAWDGESSNQFLGSLDEASVYSSVLSAQTVAQHYAFGAPAGPNQSPVAAFTSSVTNLTASFDATGSSDPDGTIASYAWDFGDGTTDAGATASHTYAAPGTYSVKLTVTDNDNAKTSVTHDVVTTLPPNQKPAAAFTSTATNLSVAFDGTASTDPDGTIASYAWDFGDGGTSTQAAPTHVFASGGTYNVALTVTDNRGGTDTQTQAVTVSAANQSPTAVATPSCTNLACSFSSAGSSDPDGTIASYAWNFGDGTTSTQANPSRTYAAAGTYTVTLTVTDNKGATGTASTNVTVTAPANQSPTAAITPSCTNLACSFSSAGSTDPDGTIASYAWNFGDGTTSTQANPSRTYAAAGTYTVTLTVTDNKGATGSTTQSVTVSAANQSPTAAFTQTCTNLACSFSSAGSSDPDGTIASYAWAFGDGTTSTQANPSRTYAAPGTYTVSLTVTDDKGATGTTSKAVTVTAVASALAADAFGRTVANGWGTADAGGAWTISGASGNFAVTGGVAQQKLASAGLGIGASLNGVSQTSTDTLVTFSSDKVVSGNGAYVWVTGRKVGTNEYRGRARLLSSGGVAVQVSRTANGAETAIGSETTVAGLTYAAGTQLNMRLQVDGTGTTTLRFRVWRADQTEPTTWQKTGTDTTAALQAAGGVGFNTYLSGSSTSAPVTISFDDLAVTKP